MFWCIMKEMCNVFQICFDAKTWKQFPTHRRWWHASWWIQIVNGSWEWYWFGEKTPTDTPRHQILQKKTPTDTPGHQIPTFEIFGHKSLGDLTGNGVNVNSKREDFQSRRESNLLLGPKMSTIYFQEPPHLVLNDGSHPSFDIVKYIAELRSQLLILTQSRSFVTMMI